MGVIGGGAMRTLPDSMSDAEVFAELERYASGDLDPHTRRMWGHIYYAGLSDVVEIARRAYTMFMDKTMLDFTVYPSILRMENDVVAMTASLLNSDDSVVGNFTYGGTESIMLALKAARDYFKKKKGENGEVILPSTAHPAFYKSAEFLGLKPVRVGLDDDLKASVEEVKEAVSKKTAMIVGSAPNYPFGVMDDIKALSEIAQDRKIWMHVDACLGGFVLPFFRKLGEKVPDFDFSLEGVSSISADLHKYGYAPRGASVILHRGSELRENHVFVMASWPGYPIVNTAVLSTRSAGTLAASWAVMHYLGEKGYLRLSEMILKAKRKLIKELPSIGLELIGKPEGSVLAFTSELNVFRISSIMAEKGWYVQSQPGSKHLNFPKSLHFSVNPGHAEVVDSFVQDMKDAVEKAKGSEEIDLSSFMTGDMDIISSLGISEGELPENMEMINELIHVMPPEVVEEIFRKIVNEMLFKPSRY
jgi:glutamate/tyrosine decarboxylase-like PLP-dependent enzyme